MGTNSSFRVCDQCHQRIPADSVFCPDCGASLRPTRVSRQARGATVKEGQNLSALWGLIGAGVLLGVVLVLTHHGPHSKAALGGSGHPKSKTSSPAPRKSQSNASGSPPSTTKKKTSTPPQTKAKTTTKKSSKPPSAKKGHHSSAPPTILAGWSTRSLHYQGATIGLTLPKSLTESATKVSSGEWEFANTGNRVYRVVVDALPPSSNPPAGSSSLGPNAYGTPISQSGQVATQTLYIDWTGHAWIAVEMAVPASHSNWLGTIAQSVRIG